MSQVFGNGLMPYVHLFAELCVAGAISFLLLAVEPVIFLFTVSLLGSATFLFYKQVSQRVKNYGAIVQESNSRILLSGNQSLEGVKGIKVLALERFFGDSFRKARMDHAQDG